jgi:hypothetical protein
MMKAACETPNHSPKWQDLAIQNLNRHRGNSIIGETKNNLAFFGSGAGPNFQSSRTLFFIPLVFMYVFQIKNNII